MNPLGVLITLILAGFLFCLPRKFAGIPLLASAFFMTLGQELMFLGLHFYVLRLLVLVGLVRVAFRREAPANLWSPIDRAMILWALVCLATSVFHRLPDVALVNRLGMIWDALGVYFLFRVFLNSYEDLQSAVKWSLVFLIPLSLAMLFEKVTAHNLFADLGGVDAIAVVREGKTRAMGPFANAINAGTAGALCLPLAALLWQNHHRLALASVVGILVIIYASASSTPVAALIGAFGLMWLWLLRRYLRAMVFAAVAGVLLLALVMKAPIWYLIARVDLVGGSTGWFRAELITQAGKHIGEWWACGTDYTRNWMPTGITWSPDQTDITNHYIMMGVLGGLPLLAAFVLILYCCGRELGHCYARADSRGPQAAYIVWVFGVIFFLHLACFLVIAYYDQLRVFWFFLLAAVGCLGQGAWHQQKVRVAAPAASRARNETQKMFLRGL